MVPSKRRGGWKRSGAPPRRRRGAPDRRRRRKPGIRSSSTIDTEDARRSEPDRAGWRELRPRTGAAALWFKITVRLENSPALIPDLEVERLVLLQLSRGCRGTYATFSNLPYTFEILTSRFSIKASYAKADMLSLTANEWCIVFYYQ